MSRPPIDPNLVTLLRLPLAPIALAVLLTVEGPWGAGVALALSLALEATDALDGWIARRWNVVSDFGKLFDPFSDAFSRFTLFLGLYAIGAADLWMILVIFYRDSGISFFRSVAAMRQVVVAARQTGKIKAIVQAIGVNAILAILVLQGLGVGPAWLADAPWWIMLVTTLVTGASFVDYLIGTWPVSTSRGRSSVPSCSASLRRRPTSGRSGRSRPPRAPRRRSPGGRSAPPTRGSRGPRSASGSPARSASRRGSTRTASRSRSGRRSASASSRSAP